MVVKFNVTIIIILFFISCKDSKRNKIENVDKINQDSLLIYKKRKDDSLLLIKMNKEQHLITIAKNKKFLESLILEKIDYNSQSDYYNITSVLLKTPIEIDFTYLHSNTNYDLKIV